MRKMVSTILNNREAKILYGSKVGESIRIERGTPQGDRASPYLFILCIEILLCKINKEEGGNISGCIFNDRLKQRYNLETMLTEAYADDLAILFKWNREGLLRIKTILEGFAKVSGLTINVKKTQLMITGGDGERVGSEIHGFKIVDNIEILGIKIDRRLCQIDENWEKALGKMVNKANYWNHFRLSIWGTSDDCKNASNIPTNIQYLMGTLPVGKNILDRANEVIISFVNGKERKIAANRHFLARESGGYGITDMNILNMCIKASWIKRWCSSEKNDDYSEMR